MAEFILVVLISIIAIIAVYFKWSFGYWSRKGVKAPPARFPFGNATNIFLQKASLGVLLKDIYLDSKLKGWKYCGFYFLAKPTLLVLDPELVKSILTKDFPHFTSHGMYMNEEDDPISAHLVALKGPEWKKCRTKLSPSFSVGKVKMMFETLSDCTNNLIAVMDKAITNQEVVDINDIVMRFTIDVIGSCAFGIECNALKNPKSEFISIAKRLTGEESLIQHLKNLVAVTVPSLLSFFHIPMNSPDLSKFFINITRETISYREENNVLRKDFMHLLIQLKNNVTIEDEDKVGGLKNKGASEESLTVEQIAAQALLFYLGGYETSSTALTFCLFELVTNLKIQERLRKEIVDVLAQHNGKITYDSLIEMTYMDKCINETLRKYPPLPMLFRECTETYKMPDSEVVIDKGTAVFIPILGIHHDPEFYPDPEKFDPERFSPENKSKQRQYTWLPFGEGPRICIGLRFGLVQMKVALAVLLKNYRFTLNPKTKVPLVIKPSSIFLSVKEGVWLNTEPV